MGNPIEPEDLQQVFTCQKCDHESREKPTSVEPVGKVVETHATCPYCGTAKHRIEWVER